MTKKELKQELKKCKRNARREYKEMLTEAERVSRALYCGDPESYNNTPKDVEEDINRHAADWMLLYPL